MWGRLYTHSSRSLCMNSALPEYLVYCAAAGGGGGQRREHISLHGAQSVVLPVLPELLRRHHLPGRDLSPPCPGLPGHVAFSSLCTGRYCTECWLACCPTRSAWWMPCTQTPTSTGHSGCVLLSYSALQCLETSHGYSGIRTHTH